MEKKLANMSFDQVKELFDSILQIKMSYQYEYIPEEKEINTQEQSTENKTDNKGEEQWEEDIIEEVATGHITEHILAIDIAIDQGITGQDIGGGIMEEWEQGLKMAMRSITLVADGNGPIVALQKRKWAVGYVQDMRFIISMATSGIIDRATYRFFQELLIGQFIEEGGINGQ